MFYYTEQLSTPSFPIWFVKTKSDYILESVDIGLVDEPWKMNAGDSCD